MNFPITASNRPPYDTDCKHIKPDCFKSRINVMLKCQPPTIRLQPFLFISCCLFCFFSPGVLPLADVFFQYSPLFISEPSEAFSRTGASRQWKAGAANSVSASNNQEKTSAGYLCAVCVSINTHFWFYFSFLWLFESVTSFGNHLLLELISVKCTTNLSWFSLLKIKQVDKSSTKPYLTFCSRTKQVHF